MLSCFIIYIAYEKGFRMEPIQSNSSQVTPYQLYEGCRNLLEINTQTGGTTGGTTGAGAGDGLF